MRILYVSLSYIPSRRASSVQVMKMCTAMARRGHSVSLVAKRGAESSAEGVDDHAFYSVEPCFELVKLARPLRRGGGVVYAANVARELMRRRNRYDLVYCRDLLAAVVATQLGMQVVLEAHAIPDEWWLRDAIARVTRARRFIGVVSITEALRRDLIAEGLVPGGCRHVVAHDACDPPRAAVTQRALGRPPVVGYVGNLYRGRGIEMVVELARVLPGIRFVVVGGSDADIARWRREPLPGTLELLGFRPQAELPALYRQFDIVVMPHARSGVHGATGGDISRWTSPMKMFEYLASGVPLVASDLPVLREVLRHGENALVADVASVAAWKAAIERLLAEPELRLRLAQAGQETIIRSHTWDARARDVLLGLGLETAASGGIVAR